MSVYIDRPQETIDIVDKKNNEFSRKKIRKKRKKERKKKKKERKKSSN